MHLAGASPAQIRQQHGMVRLCSAMSPKVEERNDLVAFHLVGLMNAEMCVERPRDGVVRVVAQP